MAVLGGIDIVPLRPMSCGSLVWSRRGSLHLTIVAKATFGMVNGGKARRIAPVPIVAKDTHRDRSPLRSLERASDLAPYLSRADLVVEGRAHAPGGVAVPAMSVRFSVARKTTFVDKTLLVFGDRRVATPGAPAPFLEMPIVYDRAYGGAGFDANPAGIGATGDPATTRAPNIVDPRDPRTPAGFGPIAQLWRLGRPMPIQRRHVGPARSQVPPLGPSSAHARGAPWPTVAPRTHV